MKLSNLSSPQNELTRQSSGLNPKVLFEVCLSTHYQLLSSLFQCFFVVHVEGRELFVSSRKSSTFLLCVGCRRLSYKRIIIHSNYHFYFHHQSNIRPESRLFSFLTPLAWSIWISMVSDSCLFFYECFRSF